VLGNGDEEGLAAGLGTGNVVVVHATVHPDTCRRLAARLAAAGIDLLDAPVSGGRVAAAAGRLTVMVGGDQKALDACRPLFDTYASAVSHVGPVGAGQTVKLLNNLVFAAQLAVAHDVVELGERLGVDAEKLLEVLAQGSGASAALGIYGRLGSLAALGQGIDLLAKDLDLMADVAS